jgi:hypothetical protein
MSQSFFSHTWTHFQNRCRGRRISPRVLRFTTLIAASLIATTLFAADKANEVEYPLVVLNFASVQRLRDNAGLMFDTADRVDVVTKFDEWIVKEWNDAKGVDRTRPLGIMFYLSPAILGPPVGYSYLPVTNLDEALTTLAHDGGVISPVAGNQNQHRIYYSERVQLATLYQDGYLFIAGKEAGDTPFDRNLPDPEKLGVRLTTQYDVALSFMLKSLSSGLKTTFLTYFNAQSKAHLQQRNEEPDSVYRFRRANGEFWIELVSRIVNQGEEMTLGSRLDTEKNIASIEFEVAGTRDSKFAKFFQGMVGKRTAFGNLLENPSTFTLSTSILFEEKQRKLFVTYFETALKDLQATPESGDASEIAKYFEPIIKTMILTSDVGHLDTIAQLTGSEQGTFALVAGIKVATTRSLPDQVNELLEYLQDNPNGNELLERMEIGFDTIDSQPVHRLSVQPDEDGGRRMFGESAHLYLYATPQFIWFAFGGESALDALRNAIQTVSLPQDVQQTRNRVPFQFITHAQNWLSVADTENHEGAVISELAGNSFQSDNDKMSLEIRPTDSGVKLRMEFESGYLSFLGRGVSRRIDMRAKESGERRPDQADPQPDQIEPQN